MDKLKEIEIQIKELEKKYNTSKNNTDSLKESLDKLCAEQHELQRKQNENLRNKKELGKLKEGYLYYKLKDAKLESFNENDKSVYLYINKIYIFEYNEDDSFNVQINNHEIRCHFGDILCGIYLYKYPKNIPPSIKEVSCVECDVAEKEIKELLERCCLKEIK